jgi:hypothetical protein
MAEQLWKAQQDKDFRRSDTMRKGLKSITSAIAAGAAAIAIATAPAAAADPSPDRPAAIASVPAGFHGGGGYHGGGYRGGYGYHGGYGWHGGYWWGHDRPWWQWGW